MLFRPRFRGVPRRGQPRIVVALCVCCSIVIVYIAGLYWNPFRTARDLPSFVLESTQSTKVPSVRPFLVDTPPEVSDGQDLHLNPDSPPSHLIDTAAQQDRGPELPPKAPQPISKKQKQHVDTPEPIKYVQCPVTSYNIPGFGPLHVTERPSTGACSHYLYGAPFSRGSLSRGDQNLPENTINQSDDGGAGSYDIAEAIEAASNEMDSLALFHPKLERANTSWPPSHTALPVDLLHWPTHRMHLALSMRRASNIGSIGTDQFPNYLHLMQHPTTLQATEAFMSRARCLLTRSGLVDAARQACDTEGALDRVIAWPQVLSYSTEAFMPTGRESSLAGSLLRGVYVAETNSQVLLRMYDPRAPLETMEVQDDLQDMYSLILRSGDLVLLPSWIQLSIVLQPHGRRKASSAPDPVTPPGGSLPLPVKERDQVVGQRVVQQSARQQERASILNFALPGDSAATAATVVPMDLAAARARVHIEAPGHNVSPPHVAQGAGGGGSTVTTGSGLDAQQHQGGGDADAGIRKPKPPGGGEVEGVARRLHAAVDDASHGDSHRDPAKCSGHGDWWVYGNPVAVYNLTEVRAGVDLGEVETLALAIFTAFRSSFSEHGDELDRNRPGDLNDVLFFWQKEWTPEKDALSSRGDRDYEFIRAFSRYQNSAAFHDMEAAVIDAVSDLMRGVGKGALVRQPPTIFSWITVHDASTSFHGRHYHRDQAMTAVLYLQVSEHSAPLEFTNPVLGADSVPNGRTVFMPRCGDFVLFPSYLAHTVPMRHTESSAPPRISLAFNILFAGTGLRRYGVDLPDETRDDAGIHQYLSVSDVVVAGQYVPRQGYYRTRTRKIG